MSTNLIIAKYKNKVKLFAPCIIVIVIEGGNHL
nr:MAG TPA: hypothetical protein [Caudoviricetes sp.]